MKPPKGHYYNHASEEYINITKSSYNGKWIEVTGETFNVFKGRVYPCWA